MNLTGNTIFITGGGSASGSVSLKCCMGKATRSSSRDGAKVRWKSWEERIRGLSSLNSTSTIPRAGTSSRPARHATAGVYRRNDQNLVDRCTRGLPEQVAFLRNSTGPNDAEVTNSQTIGLQVGRTSTGTETELQSKAGLPNRKEKVRCSQLLESLATLAAT